MMGKNKKTDAVEAIAEKMIEDFPLTSIINENFLEKYVMSAREYPDSEEKVLERTQYFVQTSYLASGKIWTALENQPHQPTPQTNPTKFDNNGFILDEQREKRPKCEMCCWYFIWCCFG